ncbi:alpha-amylase family glycosyl hydrolase [Niveispirillum sp. KHB5.9]|uniref:alpha-amylase family glycosyl hydrolase n=1 Tax=Niveispirillum sp. KHB5.9 TaxID=3400269 RepID=UPI003A88CB09
MSVFPLPLPDDADLSPRLSARIDRHWPRVLSVLRGLYGEGGWEQALAARLLAAAVARPADLRALDIEREAAPDWFQRPERVGYCTYIDRFGGTLAGTRAKLDELSRLGVTYFHPLPLLKPREGDSDGGFAVADFRQVDPRLGTIDDLRALATDLRARGISLCLDIVCNHTADTHPWAMAAKAGDPALRAFYHVVETAEQVAALEAHLGQVFPQTAPGNFTFVDEMGGHVWTTFYPFQWDMNYANPAVFIEMMDVLLYLANQGAELFRLDSAPFLWKRPGTDCRGLQETHLVVQAWRGLLAIAAPAVALKAEAIVGLAEVLPFLGDAAAPECHLAYNNTAMTALWAALATGDTRPLSTCLTQALAKPAGAGWLTYVRCHDDIIWSALKGVIADDRLAWISDFYAGSVSGSFADGRAFQAEPGSVRSTNGMAASLCGMRAGVDDEDALARLRLLYGVTFALDGIPAIYMGDERALTNDAGYADEPDHADGRWLHRPRMDWDRPEGPLHAAIARFAALRRGRACLHAANPARPLATDDPALLAFERADGSGDRLVCLGHFKGASAVADLSALLGAGDWHDLLDGTDILAQAVPLAPWGLRWLVRRRLPSRRICGVAKPPDGGAGD